MNFIKNNICNLNFLNTIDNKIASSPNCENLDDIDDSKEYSPTKIKGDSIFCDLSHDCG